MRARRGWTNSGGLDEREGEVYKGQARGGNEAGLWNLFPLALLRFTCPFHLLQSYQPTARDTESTSSYSPAAPPSPSMAANNSSSTPPAFSLSAPGANNPTELNPAIAIDTANSPRATGPYSASSTVSDVSQEKSTTHLRGNDVSLLESFSRVRVYMATGFLYATTLACTAAPSSAFRTPSPAGFALRSIAGHARQISPAELPSQRVRSRSGERGIGDAPSLPSSRATLFSAVEHPRDRRPRADHFSRFRSRSKQPETRYEHSRKSSNAMSFTSTIPEGTTARQSPTSVDLDAQPDLANVEKKGKILGIFPRRQKKEITPFQFPDPSPDQMGPFDRHLLPSVLYNMFDPKSYQHLAEIGGTKAVLEGLRTDPKNGLKEGDNKEERVRVYGANRIPQKKTKSFLALCWAAYTVSFLHFLYTSTSLEYKPLTLRLRRYRTRS